MPASCPLPPVALALAMALTLPACSQPPKAREYPLVGQVVRVERSTSRVTIRHEDIPGFMPAMTMPFPVKPAALLDGREPGDLVTATLLVDGAEVWIGTLTKTGHAPLPPEEANPAGVLVPGDRVADQAFIDHRNQPLALDWLDGHVSVVTFVYTRCPLPEFCPAIDSRFVALQEEIAGAPAGSPMAGVRLLSVTIDPAYDTPGVLRAHAARLGVDDRAWRLVTAEPDVIEAFGRQFGLDVLQRGPGPADIVHSLRTIILDRDRRIVEMLGGAQWTAAELAAKVRAAAGA